MGILWMDDEMFIESKVLLLGLFLSPCIALQVEFCLGASFDLFVVQGHGKSKPFDAKFFLVDFDATKLSHKLRDAIVAPVLAPGILDQPAVLPIDHIPPDDRDSVA